MQLDLEKIKELLDLLHPYMRWLMLVGYAGMFLYINRIFIKDPVLRKWILASFEEQNGRASGKAITSFVFSKLIAFATVVAIVYAPDHLLPEYFLISLLTFVGSLYGIKMASKYFNNGTVSTSESTSTVVESTTTTETKAPANNTTVDSTTTTTTEKDKKKAPSPDDIG